MASYECGLDVHKDSIYIYILYKNGSKIDSVFGSWINYVICLFPIMFVKCPLRVWVSIGLLFGITHGFVTDTNRDILRQYHEERLQMKRHKLKLYWWKGPCLCGRLQKQEVSRDNVGLINHIYPQAERERWASLFF